MRTCIRCKKTMAVELFKTDKRSPSGLTNLCKECNRSDSRRYVKDRLPIKRQEKSCNKCGITRPIDGFRKHAHSIDGHYSVCRICENTEFNDTVYAAYGGYKCACCGETEPLFLSIDHIENNGGVHRKREPQAKKLAKYLTKRGFPPGYQILCLNCNLGKVRNGGVCPHHNKK